MERESIGARLRHTDLYAILDISPDASSDDIRRGYRRSALSCHPDKHPNNQQAAEHFLLITRARDVLLDPQSRATYDRMRDDRRREVVEDAFTATDTRKRGTRRTRATDPLREQRLAERARRSRSGAELSALWQVGTVVVRAEVLRNPACPINVFQDPCVAGHWLLSLEAANRAQCPPEMLCRIANSFERSVALAVASHPATPAEALSIIAARHRDLAVLTALAAHGSANSAVLHDLARAVRGPRTASLGFAIIAHPACPEDLAERIRARLGKICA